MKRHPALQDLSRDHFVALNHVVQVRRVVEQDAFAKPLAEVWSGFVGLWHDLEPHFDEEEELLLPFLDDDERAAGHAARLRDEHGRIRQAFLELGVAPAPDETLLWNLAEELRIHIRWEEDHLFQDLQEWLSTATLEALGARNEAFRRSRGVPVGT